jgi:type I restriction enzyme S subunit
MKTYPKYKDSGIDFIGDIPEHWEVVPIKYSLAIPLTDGPHETPKLFPSGIPFISAEAIKKDKIDFNKKRGFISKEEHERFSLKYKPKLGDVYMIKSGATTGNLARVETEKDFNIWSPLAAFRPSPEKTTTDFLFFYMKSSRFFSAVELGWNYGTQQNIGMNVLENLRMVRPPVSEQTAIANYLERKTADLDHLILEKKQLVKLYQEEKTAIINQVVTKGINPNVKLKDSGIEWLGDIPEHWEVKTIKSISTYFKGMAFKSEVFKPKGIPIIKASNIKESTIKNITSFISSDNQNPNFEKVRLLTGDIIMSTVGSKPEVINSAVGQLAYISEEFSNSYLNQNTICIRANKEIYNAFLNYVLHSKYIRAKIDSIALWIANQAYIEVEKVRGTYIPIPNIVEQVEIVKHIEKETSKIDSKIAKAKKYINLLTEYRTSLISEVVTGKIKVID